MCHRHWHFIENIFLAKLSASLKILEINCQKVLNKKITQPTKVSAGILLYCSQSECSLLHQAKVFSFAQKNLWAVQVVTYWISIAQFFLAVAALGNQLQPLALVKEFSSQGAFKEFSVQGILGSRNLQARKLQSLNFRSQQFSGQGINFQAIFVWELSKRNFQSKNFRVTAKVIL